METLRTYVHFLSLKYTDKKENQIFLIYVQYKEIQNGVVTASSYMVKYLRISSYTVLGIPPSYMTLQPISSEISYILGKFDFLFLTVSLLPLRESF